MDVRRRRLYGRHWGLDSVSFEESYIEDLPFEDDAFDAVVSNGVINLSADEERVFQKANRVLRQGGRLAISDIVSDERLPESIKEDADLWASCIGGAKQADDYADVIDAAGFAVTEVRENSEYEFLSDRAQNACATYGMKSVSVGAEKP